MGAIIRLNYYLFVINKKSISKMNITALAEEGVALVANTLRMT